MRIGVFHNLPSGGAKRALFWLCRELGREHDVTVHEPDTASADFSRLDEVVREVKRYTTGSSPAENVRLLWDYSVSPSIYAVRRMRQLGAVRRLQQCIAEEMSSGQYDVILTEQDRYVYSPFLLTGVQAPCVYYCQQPYRRGRERVLDRVVSAAQRTPKQRLRRSILDVLDKALSRIDVLNAGHSRYTVTNSYFTREFIARVHGVDARISYLGIDTALFRPLGLDRGYFVLGVGTIHPNKGYEDALRALATIPSGRRPTMVIVGNTANTLERQKLARLAEQLGVTLEMRVMAEDSELVDLYNRALALLYTPRLEPFGLVPLEAMACGTPVVAVREGGPRESVVDGVTGLLVERTEVALGDAVSRLMDDRDLAARMGRAGVEDVRARWTTEQAAERLLEHLHAAMGKGGRTAHHSALKGRS